MEISYMSIPGIKQCLKREFPKTPDMETVIDTVCNRLDVTKEEILGKRRKRKIVYARHIAQYLICLLSKATVTSVADRFGARHHSTVIHARDRLKDLISVHEYTRNEVEWLKNEVYNAYLSK